MKCPRVHVNVGTFSAYFEKDNVAREGQHVEDVVIPPGPMGVRLKK